VGYQSFFWSKCRAASPWCVLAQTPVCLVVGNEVEGIADTLQSYLMPHWNRNGRIKNSLNVAVAFVSPFISFAAGLRVRTYDESLMNRFLANTSVQNHFIDGPFACWILCFRYSLQTSLVRSGCHILCEHIVFLLIIWVKCFSLWTGVVQRAPYHFFLSGSGMSIRFFSWSCCLSGLGLIGKRLFDLPGVYYFLACWAFYLIMRFLLVDRFMHLQAISFFYFPPGLWDIL